MILLEVEAGNRLDYTGLSVTAQDGSCKTRKCLAIVQLNNHEAALFVRFRRCGWADGTRGGQSQKLGKHTAAPAFRTGQRSLTS